jgi:hypothetical protein
MCAQDLSRKTQPAKSSTAPVQAKFVQPKLLAILIDTVALDAGNVVVSAPVIATSLVFGIRLENVSPISCLVTATGSIVKL